MSHPDPCYDPDNSMEDDMGYDDFDMQAERNIFPWCDDESHDNNYDDHDDFFDESMDGDHDSAMTSAGWGTDEDYGHYGDDIDAFHDYYGDDF